jgi:hypothetical protein
VLHLSSDSWHPKVPHASQRRLLSHNSNWRLLSRSSRRSLPSHSSRRSQLSHIRRRSLLSHCKRRMSSIASVTAMTRLSTLPCVTPMTQTQSRSSFEQLQSFAPMLMSHGLFLHSFMVCCFSWASPRPRVQGQQHSMNKVHGVHLHSGGL